MPSNQFTLSIQQKKLIFSGNSCEECRSLCQALCCRYTWDIKLTREEYQSGQYAAQVICLLSKEVCNNINVICSYQHFKINKKPDNSCIYLDENNYCSIHAIRPQVCRDWSCDYSFALAPKRKPEKAPMINSDSEELNDAADISDSDVYIPYPFERLITVVYVKEKSKLYFVRECLQGCERYYSETDFDQPDLDEVKILGLIHLFNKKLPTIKIRQEFSERFEHRFHDDNFFEIISIFKEQKIILAVDQLIQ
jgi:Fe-S-cluster containining protein